MKLSVVVAFFNEEKMIEKTHAEISEQLKSMVPEQLTDYERDC